MIAAVFLVAALIVTRLAYYRRDVAVRGPEGWADSFICRLPGSSPHWTCPWFECITLLCLCSLVVGYATPGHWEVVSMLACGFWGTQAAQRNWSFLP